MDLVRIEWDDAEDFSESWASQREADEFAKKSYIVTSVGWLVKKNRFYVTIASDHDPNHGNYGTLRKIPKKMIRTLEVLKLQEPQKHEEPPI